MIVPMQKIFLVARQSDRERLLAALREWAVVHLVPVDARRAVPDEITSRHMNAIHQALQILSGVEPRGSVPDLDAADAALEVLDLQKQIVEKRNHLASLFHQLEQISLWCDLRLQHVAELREAGVDLQFFELPARCLGDVQADCVAEVGALPSGQRMVAVADRGGAVRLPDQAKPLHLPARDSATLRDQAKQLDDDLQVDLARLHQLAHLTGLMEAQLARLEQQAEETVAWKGGLLDKDLFALQGWLPADQAATCSQELAARGVPAAVQLLEPSPREEPPTLIRPPAWARPIEGLFEILGTVPGYREYDVSVPFLIALPIFTAMLISDGGYGALLLLAPALAYRKATQALGAPFVQLLMLVGGVSVVWGILTNTFFGFALLPVTVIPIELTDASRLFMMRLSFVMGAIHLSLAQLWQSVRYYPDPRALSHVGWAVFICGMYGVVNAFVLQGPFTWQTPWPYLLLIGSALAILFTYPSRNVWHMLGMGLAQFPLSMLSAFSDVISYVRLMAVGLASSVLALSFNEMALEAGFWPLTVLVLILGHGLNLGLALIAMFAHGVRLNMLEFSSKLGMQWAGYAYRPFACRARDLIVDNR